MKKKTRDIVLEPGNSFEFQVNDPVWAYFGGARRKGLIVNKNDKGSLLISFGDEAEKIWLTDKVLIKRHA